MKEIFVDWVTLRELSNFRLSWGKKEIKVEGMNECLQFLTAKQKRDNVELWYPFRIHETLIFNSLSNERSQILLKRFSMANNRVRKKTNEFLKQNKNRHAKRNGINKWKLNCANKHNREHKNKVKWLNHSLREGSEQHRRLQFPTWNIVFDFHSEKKKSFRFYFILIPSKFIWCA